MIVRSGAGDYISRDAWSFFLKSGKASPEDTLKLSTLYHRLRVMTLPEIFHRLWRPAVDRLSAGLARKRAQTVRSSCLDSLSGFPSRWWDPSLLKESGMAERVSAEADSLMRGEWTIFGRAVALGTVPDWTADPFSGERTSGEGWAGIAPGLFLSGTADIRSVWELNRLQALVRLGQAYVLSGAERYAERAAELILDWSESNPYLRSANWRNALEVSLRAISLVQAAALYRESPAFAEQRFRRELAGLLWLHGHFIRTHTSRGSVALNHLAAEAAGLVVLGCCLPGLPGSERWRKLGASLLEKSVNRLLLEDGGPCEGSLHYLGFVCGLAVTAAGLAGPGGFALSAVSRERLAAAYRFLCAVTDNGRAVCGFGDSDDAAVAGPPATDPSERLHRALNLLSSYLDDTPAVHDCSPDPDSLRLFGRCGRESTERAGGDYPQLSRFDISGHYTVRAPGLFLRFECGRWGAPGAYAHAHADRLSFVLYLDSLPFLVDPGTGAYLADPLFREYFRSSRAHNTVTLNGLSQAEPLACFLHRGAVRSHLTEASTGEDMVSLAGVVSDYGGVKGLAHRRGLILRPSERRLEIEDSVEGVTGVATEICFNFHPDCRISLEREGEVWFVLARNGSREMVLLPDRECDIGLHRGEDYPLRGWYSSGFMRREPACQVALSAPENSSGPFRTVVSWR